MSVISDQGKELVNWVWKCCKILVVIVIVVLHWYSPRCMQLKLKPWVLVEWRDMEQPGEGETQP